MIINYYLFWGCFGLVVELFFTATRRLIAQKDLALIGHTSILMFPIYALGLTHGFDLIRFLIPWDILRWLSYPFWIWGVEILIGSFTTRKNIWIWDYSYLPEKYHWKGIISYAHFPIWIIFGILVELIK